MEGRYEHLTDETTFASTNWGKLKTAVFDDEEFKTRQWFLNLKKEEKVDLLKCYEA